LVRLKPDDASAHYNLGNSLKAQSKWDEAIAQFREAIRIKPDYPLAHHNLTFRGHHTQLLQPAFMNSAEVAAAGLTSDTQGQPLPLTNCKQARKAE
jgi:tetratricopeptide (TPR) repeat protein